VDDLPAFVTKNCLAFGDIWAIFIHTLKSLPVVEMEKKIDKVTLDCGI